jgi:hypothetical protein
MVEMVPCSWSLPNVCKTHRCPWLEWALVAGRLLSPCNQVPTTHQSTNNIGEHIMTLLVQHYVCLECMYLSKMVAWFGE